MSILGPVEVSWGSTFPIACTVAPDMAALGAAVASGAARAIGGSALNNLALA